MTKVFAFPTFRIESQLFHSPGAGYDGGLTAGGAQFITPEPGGFAQLELQTPVITTEWDSPLASWVMSKTSGQVFRVRLAPSPQIAYSRKRGKESVLWSNEQRWSNQEAWDGDFTARYAAASLKGAVAVTLDLTGVGPIVMPGHVIGHGDHAYLVDEISYAGAVGTAIVTPPLRTDIAAGDNAYLRPWFLGRISNGPEIRAAYDHLGHVKPGRIVLQEAVV